MRRQSCRGNIQRVGMFSVETRENMYTGIKNTGAVVEAQRTADKKRLSLLGASPINGKLSAFSSLRTNEEMKHKETGDLCRINGSWECVDPPGAEDFILLPPFRLRFIPPSTFEPPRHPWIPPVSGVSASVIALIASLLTPPSLFCCCCCPPSQERRRWARGRGERLSPRGRAVDGRSRDVWHYR